MAKHQEWSVMDYDYTKTYPDIDYSEVVTEPGLVLSMREIYQRYAAAGQDLLAGQLVKDDDSDSDLDPFVPDDEVDVLAHASELRRIGASKQRALKHSENKPQQAEDTKPEDPKEPDKPKQSEGAEGDDGD